MFWKFPLRFIILIKNANFYESNNWHMENLLVSQGLVSFIDMDL